jgi:hypothetical protein
MFYGAPVELQNLRFSAVLMRIQVFWSVMLCCWASGSSYFEDGDACHLEGQAVYHSFRERKVPLLPVTFRNGNMIDKIQHICHKKHAENLVLSHSTRKGAT